MDDMSDETKADKPRGACTGCKFEYQLSTARSGEFKGELVTRKHNSRTGPGLCEGASKPPAVTDPEPEEDSPTAELRAEGAFEPSGAPAPGVGTVTAPGPVFTAEFDSDGSCGHFILEGDEIRADGEGGYLCADCAASALPFTDPAPPMPSGGILAAGENQYASTVPTTNPARPVDPAAFTDPAPMPAELPPVSGQPEPDRDRWGRYVLPGVDGSKVGHTRATTFAKLGSSTYALGEWNERMLIKGLTERPDLLALAHGLDVKRDKKQLNSIADDAQTHAGNKVAANIGTAYHTFTERLDAGLITLADVPVQYRARCEQYLDAVRAHGLVTRPEWMERTTAVRADQVSAPAPVAGTLDRIWQLPNGELVIGDLKTGSDLSYGWAEIAVQLAIYAHGVNTFGLFDWNTKTWDGRAGDQIRTDFAIVMHLPADGDGCILYRVDLIKGWKYAQVSGMVQSRQKDKSVAGVLAPGSLGPVTSPVSAQRPGPSQAISGPAAESPTQLIRPTVAPDPLMERASRLIDAAVHADELITLLKHAGESGRFTNAQFEELKGLCGLRWEALQVV